MEAVVDYRLDRSGVAGLLRKKQPNRLSDYSQKQIDRIVRKLIRLADASETDFVTPGRLLYELRNSTPLLMEFLSYMTDQELVDGLWNETQAEMKLRTDRFPEAKTEDELKEARRLCRLEISKLRWETDRKLKLLIAQSLKRKGYHKATATSYSPPNENVVATMTAMSASLTNLKIPTLKPTRL